MLTRWSDFEFGDLGRGFDTFDNLRRRMDRLFEEWDRGIETGHLGGDGARQRLVTWPAANLYDAGDAFVVQAMVPGVDRKDLEIHVDQDSFTVSGERKAEAPQGYAVHRRERSGLKFSRSFTLPSKLNPEHTEASLKNGVLTVRLGKAPEARPRKIDVKVS